MTSIGSSLERVREAPISLLNDYILDPLTMSESLTFVVGNRAVQQRGGGSRWNVFVKLIPNGPIDNNTKYEIDRIRALLHSSYRPNVVKLGRLQENEFRSRDFVGWRKFVVKLEVYILDQGVSRRQPIVLQHELDLECGGSTSEPIEIELSSGLPKERAVVGDNMGSQEDVQQANKHIDPIEKVAHRAETIARLSSTTQIRPDSPLFWHGRYFSRNHLNNPLQEPICIWKSSEKPRDDHSGTPVWLTASEYCDTAIALQAKVEVLAKLLRLSNNTVIYSGAGISRAAGIGTAARGSRGRVRNLSTTAQPTTTHHALARLAQAGYITGGWVQQNHDGLPQKAGFPQESINEIHGSWYDPSNPVVVYSGSLKSRECEWMEEIAGKADLALVLGTSLGGLNADQVAHRAAKRSLNGRSLGMVLLNLQQTEHDGMASLRLFGETDRILSALLKELLLQQEKCIVPKQMKEKMRVKVLVPYDSKGRRSTTHKMWWDLRPGAAVKLSGGHNVKGAGQPSHRRLRNNAGKVTSWRDDTSGIHMNIDGVPMCLGQWWVEAAVRGGPSTLPVINLNPETNPRRILSDCGSSSRSYPPP